MKKLFVLTLIIYIAISVFSVTSFAEDDTPVIKASGVSIRIPDNSIKGGLRFKMRVEIPLPKGVEIVEQGTLIIPLHAIEYDDKVAGTSYAGELLLGRSENLDAKERNVYALKELTLETPNVLKAVNTDSEYYTQEDTYYEFITSLEGVFAFNFKSDICARGYIKYNNDGEEKVVYGDTVIYDVYSIAEKMCLSEKESVDNKNAVKSFIIDAHEAYYKIDGGNEEGLLTITSPVEDQEVYPYHYSAKKYLKTDKYLVEFDKLTEDNNGVQRLNLDYFEEKSKYKVARPQPNTWDPVVPIEIKWTNKYKNVASFTVLYATKSDFSDAKYVYASATSSSVKVFNLYKASTYYVKVIANLKDGTNRTATSSFKTTDLGPRVIHLDGMYNARDLGGYMTPSGRTLQGLLYRSGQPDSTFSETYFYPTVLSTYGKHTASQELGIKVQFDFRSLKPESVIPRARLVHVTVGSYRLASENTVKEIKNAFSVLADVNNYPLIFHCQGGADRTGTIAFFALAVLGVSEADIQHDYEFTTFSIYSIRNVLSTAYMSKPDYVFFETLNAQKGDTLQEKSINYLLSIGVTQEEIDNFTSIMFTGKSVK